MRTKRKKTRWACPKCGATAHRHGRGGRRTCYGFGYDKKCEGFLCVCWEDSYPRTEEPGHGSSLEKQCPHALCHHCGWEGAFPIARKRAAKPAKPAKKTPHVPARRPSVMIDSTLLRSQEVSIRVQRRVGPMLWSNVPEVLEAVADVFERGLDKPDPFSPYKS